MEELYDNKYQYIKLLGEGAFGKVFLAKDKLSNRLIAIKQLKNTEPGGLILTGTPEGVIMGLPEKKWLRPGDVVRVEIEKLGYSENRIT
jgi:serine/threonine protein kinase